MFADALYWIALSDPTDAAHREAQVFDRTLGFTIILTTDEVLIEFLTFSGSDPGCGLKHPVAGIRFRRVREVVILKTPGATRWRVSKIFSVEFLVLGAVAGLMGTLLANGFANLLLYKLLNGKLRVDVVSSLVCIGATALIANLAGWVASFRILGQKPLQVLREE